VEAIQLANHRYSRKNVDDSLAQELAPDMSALDAWKLLKKRTQQDGMVAKLNAMRAAITTKFSSSKATNATIGDIRDLITAIFKGDPPMKEDWTIILMLNALEGTDLDWLRKNLITQFISSKTRPTEKEVIEAINLAGYDRRQTDQVHAFKTQKESNPKQKMKCSNCENNRHVIEGCWAKGGGSAGKAPDWWNELQAKKAGKPKGKDQEKANALKDNDSSNSHTESVGAAIVETDFAERFEDGYMSCPAIEITPNHPDAPKDPGEKCSVLWNRDTMRTPVNTTDVRPMTKEERVASMDKPDTPFYIDSGATSHCSPVRGDFISLVQIEVRNVKGMNGSYVSAIGRGTISLRCEEGTILKLVDVLYIPQAALRLISVGRLPNEGLESTFNKTSCIIRNKPGRMIARGTRRGRELYSFDGSPRAIKQACIARSTPNLQTWHRRLSHVNYASIITMAKNRLASGMPIDLSSLPPICEHCVVGKQTKTPVPKIREGERARERLEKVHSDITGPEDVNTKAGEKYMLNFIDDASGMSWIYPLKEKSDAVSLLST
jgi:hypothetical protein